MRRSSQGRVTKWRARNGSVAPISVVGTSNSPADAMNRSTDSSAYRSPNALQSARFNPG